MMSNASYTAVPIAPPPLPLPSSQSPAALQMQPDSIELDELPHNDASPTASATPPNEGESTQKDVSIPLQPNRCSELQYAAGND